MSLWSKLSIILLSFFCAKEVSADLKIDISGAITEPIPISIPYFTGIEPLAKDITDIVSADLERSGLFRLINREAYIQHITNFNTKPHFPDWQAIQTHALLVGHVEETSTGDIKVSYQLWDIFTQNRMDARTLISTSQGKRKIAHIIADFVYERITGEHGYFDTQIVFVSEKGPQNKRIKRLAIMDQDGANFRYLTTGKNIALTPRFSPDRTKITYFSYQRGQPHVYLMDIKTGESELVGHFDGMSFAPQFSMDGNLLIMSLAKHGNSDIYLYNLQTKKQTRLTNHPAIDTSPSFSPNGKQIVFSSDRSGNQQLYIMSQDGSNIKRISFGEGTYATPLWSPRGDFIAFTKIKNGQFHIGVMHPDGSGERLIANGFLVEGPSWAPNGRVLSFFKQTPWDSNGKGGTTKLYSIDITGYNEQQLDTPEDGSSPSWSTLAH